MEEVINILSTCKLGDPEFDMYDVMKDAVEKKFATHYTIKKMTTIELLEESLKQLKIIQLDNLRREPNHPRNKFDYTVIVPDHPLGYHEHYTMDLEVD